jgi:phage major head subunit gpT-like protein
MIINQQNLATLTTGYKAAFQQGLDGVKTEWAQYAIEVPSTTAEELYPWLQKIPGMRKWVGERQINNVRTASYKIINDKFEDTVTVERTKIEDDTYAVYTPTFRLLGDAAARQPDELVFAGISSGFTSNCFDGQYFFDTDHPVLDASGSAVSVSNMQAGAGAPWMLLDLSKAMKPFIFQNRQKPRFVSKVDPKDDHVFFRDEYVYGVDSRNAFGFGFWQLAFGSRAALDEANFEAAYDAMIRMKGDYGQPLGIKPTHLLTSPANRSAAETILKKLNKAGGESNLNFERVQLAISSFL